MQNQSQNGGTVVAFRRPSDDAVGRNRQLAARAIGCRLRELVRSADFQASDWGPVAGLDLGAIHVFFNRNLAGMYFSVEERTKRDFLMTGYLDPLRSGNYNALGMHIMSWRRGWEWRLFPQAQAPSAARHEILQFGG